LLVDGLRTLIITITSFTIAHSITLALVTLGIVPTPSPIIEVLIALSIVFLAVEVLHRRSGKNSWSVRQPWIMALVFGLLHGMGFASALLDIGLPISETIMALLFFNLGVEVGQLLFLTVIVSLFVVVFRISWSIPSKLNASASYVIGTAGAYWFVERLVNVV